MKKVLTSLLVFSLGVLLFSQVPDWHWAQGFGSAADDYAFGLAVDAAGNNYVGAWFQGTVQFGNTSLTSFGDVDIAVIKLDNAGNVLWVRQAGSTTFDCCNGIAVDAGGNVYITGSFTDTAQFGDISVTSDGQNDIYVAKLDSDGTWQWVSTAGGTAFDRGRDIALDSEGNPYILGFFNETGYFWANTLVSSGQNDIFVAKLDSEGTWLWAVKGGGASYDYPSALCLDNSDNVFVCGYFMSTASFGDYSITSAGYTDSFVAKLGPDHIWQWARRTGGNGYQELDAAEDAIIDPAGNVYLCGEFYATADCGPYQLTNNGQCDLYIAKLDTDGNWQWVVTAGSTSYDYATSLSLDNAGNLYLLGSYSATMQLGSVQLSTQQWCYSTVIAKLNTSHIWEWAIQSNGSADVTGVPLSRDPAGNLYLAGTYSGSCSFGTHALTNAGARDIFVVRAGSFTGADDETVSSSSLFSKVSACPNPFISQAKLDFTLASPASCDIIIYDAKGRTVRHLHSGSLNSGSHALVWNGRDDNGKPVTSGVYLFSINSGDITHTGKILHLQ